MIQIDNETNDLITVETMNVFDQCSHSSTSMASLKEHKLYVHENFR